MGLAELAVFASDDAKSELWGNRAFKFARASGQVHVLCKVTLFIGCILPVMRGDHARLASKAAKIKELATAQNLPMWLA